MMNIPPNQKINTAAELNFSCVIRKEKSEKVDKIPLGKSPLTVKLPLGIQAFCLQLGKLATETHLQFAIKES